MKNILPILVCITFYLTACENPATVSGKKAEASFKKIPVDYPTTYKDTTISEDYHGLSVPDPYRWLENDNAAQTKEWVKAQNHATFSYLDQIPFRDAIEERLQKIWNYERISTPFKKGGKFYYFKNDGLQNQSVLYEEETPGSTAKPVLDPNHFSADGTASLGNYAFSKSGRYLAYEVSEGGSDWKTIYVKDLKKDEVLKDKVEWVKFSEIAWHKNGFFYSRYPEPAQHEALSGKNEFHSIYYHKLGTPQSEDEIIFADRSNPGWGFYANTSSDERFLIVGVWESTSGNALYFKNLTENNGEFVPVTKSFDADFNYVDLVNKRLLVVTNYKADNNRLIAISTDRPEEGYWEEILPESENKLADVQVIGGKLVALYIQDAYSALKILDLSGTLEKEIELPGIGTVEEIKGKKEEPEAFFSFTSFTGPSTIYQLNTETFATKVYKKPNIDFASEEYETKQIWYESYDKTRVPMFITHRKGLILDGKRPTLLYGYGGFDISILPQFNLTRINLAPIILENDGIFAVANIRGGGEFGKQWHKAGTKDQKQNVFNDFQAAAEYLIDQNYTSSEKLAIYGRSNGGLLVGACMTQRPDLYKVVLPAVGVLDMLRYDKFTIGRAWATDYGLSENPEEFDFLYAYSPLHNVKPKQYPATMVTTADHDDRVVPAHSFKFGAAVQENQQGEAPVLIRIASSAGHGAGKPTSKKIEEAADILSFTFYNFGEDVSYEYKVLE